MLTPEPKARWRRVGDGIHQLSHQGHTATVTLLNGGRASYSVAPNGPVGHADSVPAAQVECEEYLVQVPEADVRVEIPVCLLADRLRRGPKPNIAAIRDDLLRGHAWPGCELIPIPIPC